MCGIICLIIVDISKYPPHFYISNFHKKTFLLNSAPKISHMPNKSCDCGIFVYNFTWNVVFNVSVSDQKCQREDRFLTKKITLNIFKISIENYHLNAKRNKSKRIY